jgi:hypothetical protein
MAQTGRLQTLVDQLLELTKLGNNAKLDATDGLQTQSLLWQTVLEPYRPAPPNCMPLMLLKSLSLTDAGVRADQPCSDWR